MVGLIIFSVIVFLLVLSGVISRIYFDKRIDEVKTKLEQQSKYFRDSYNEETWNSFIREQRSKAFTYLSRKKNIKKNIGKLGVLFGVMTCILTGMAMHFTKNTDTVSDIIEVLKNNKILSNSEFERISAKISINNLFSSGILLYSGLSQMFLLSIVVYDLFLPDKEHSKLRKELDRITNE
ncbi:hypothetical protein D7Z26_10250 [Cohnella endophytica]|uniref:Uncharacterized protein n=1 Tax=Cohnella endophytica TaxID=2419778 RepID=A0A494XY79_9BACL|nr:hypothetical protein [Cohnella endophytica]RKP55555.1 hypothetical protein D7Z26_10250 [Cohnella endophytica]